MIKVYFCFLFILLVSCSSSKTRSDINNEIISSYSAKVKRKLQLEVQGTGGSIPKDIKEIFISFVSKERADINRARELFLDITEGLLEQVNSDDTIRSYLHNYPFTNENLEIDLCFYQSSGKRFDDGSIAFVFNTKGKIFYCSYDSKIMKLIDLHEETYEEALTILRKSDPTQIP